MKVLLALTIILGGVLISKTTYADSSGRIIQPKSSVSGGNVDVVPSAVFAENAPGVTKPCTKLLNASAKLKGGDLNASNLGSSKKTDR